MEKLERILLVEDDPNFGSVLKSYLELNSYEVHWEKQGRSALEVFNKDEFDLILLDVMLPGIDGFNIATRIKESNIDTPFIFITAKTLKQDIVKGYKSGADEYITKPFDSEILLYKIKAVLKRNMTNRSFDEYRIGDYRFLFKTRELIFPDDSVRKVLSPKETELLRLLMEYEGDVLAKSTALNRIWGDTNYFTSRSMDVYITKLRKYLESDRRIRIITIHGHGYRLYVESIN